MLTETQVPGKLNQKTSHAPMRMLILYLVMAEKNYFLIEAYNSVYKHDFICTSETFLDSSISEALKGSPEKDI